MGEVQSRTERALSRLLPAAHVAPARLHEAMRYAVLGGGKRVRPLLGFAAGEVTGATPERLESRVWMAGLLVLTVVLSYLMISTILFAN